VWDVISGRDRITVSLISAEDAVDTGARWNQKTIDLKGYELFDELVLQSCWRCTA
jgi:methionyl-tRNA formyltransferase